MSTGTIRLQGICNPAGDHVTLRMTIGANTFDYAYITDDFTGPFDEDSRKVTVQGMARFHCLGMTKAQAKAAMNAGITVTTSS